MIKPENKDFVWYGTRGLFWTITLLFVLLVLFSIPLSNISDGANQIILGIWLFLNLFLLILSIIHLSYYKQRAFAVVSLVLSSVGVLIGLIGFFAFMFVGIVNNSIMEGAPLIDESDTLVADHYSAYYLDLPADSIISINLSSTERLNAFLLEESEFNRFSSNSSNETWYYLQKIENSSAWHLTDYRIEVPGRYRILIVSLDKNKNLTYDLLVTRKISFSSE